MEPALRQGSGGGAGDARFGEHSADSIRFPPFNQVTQAWNARLCQTQSVLGCLRNNGLSGLLMRREAVVSFFPALNGSLDVTTDRNHWKDKQQGASQEHPVLLQSSFNLILVSSVAAECQYEQR